MIYDFLYENLNFLYGNLNFLCENLRFSLWKILVIFSMSFLTIHKIFYHKVRVSTGSVETRWLGGSFLMVYRNNTGRLGSGFISVCLETRWLGQKSGFYVTERYCTHCACARVCVCVYVCVRVCVCARVSMNIYLKTRHQKFWQISSMLNMSYKLSIELTVEKFNLNTGHQKSYNFSSLWGGYD